MSRRSDKTHIPGVAGTPLIDRSYRDMHLIHARQLMEHPCVRQQFASNGLLYEADPLQLQSKTAESADIVSKFI
jgi:hypothetical protein